MRTKLCRFGRQDISDEGSVPGWMRDLIRCRFSTWWDRGTAGETLESAFKWRPNEIILHEIFYQEKYPRKRQSLNYIFVDWIIRIPPVFFFQKIDIYYILNVIKHFGAHSTSKSLSAVSQISKMITFLQNSTLQSKFSPLLCQEQHHRRHPRIAIISIGSVTATNSSRGVLEIFTSSSAVAENNAQSCKGLQNKCDRKHMIYSHKC